MALLNQFHKFSRSILGVKATFNKRLTNKSLPFLHGARSTSTTQPLSEKQEVNITFIRANGEKIKAKGKVGDTILDIVVNNDIDLDGYGACEGTLTCSTCHLIFPKEVYNALPDKPTDEELDMLDLAYELTDTSRLGCQIVMTKELDGIEVRVPTTINDDSHIPSNLLVQENNDRTKSFDSEDQILQFMISFLHHGHFGTYQEESKDANSAALVSFIQ